MKMLLLWLVGGVLWPTQASGPLPLKPGQEEVVVFGEPGPEKPRGQEFVFQSSVDGFLLLHAQSDSLRPSLSFQRTSDDSALSAQVVEPRHVYLRARVRVGTQARVRLSAADAGAGRIRLRAVLLSESAQTLALADSLNRLAADLHERWKQIGLEELRSRVRPQLDLLRQAGDEETRSLNVAIGCDRLSQVLTVDLFLFAEALKLSERSVDIASDLLPEWDAILLRLRSQHGYCVAENGDLDEGEKLLRDVLHHLPASAARLPWLRAMTLSNLADVLVRHARPKEALPLAQEACQIAKSSRGELSQEHRSYLTTLAKVYKELALFEQAREIEERLVAELRRTRAPDDTTLLQQQLLLAHTLRYLGDLNAARVMEQEVVQAYSRSLPGDSFLLQAARENLAVTLGMLGELDESTKLLREVVVVMTKTLPPDHAELQLARQNLAVNLKELGHLEEARVLEEQILEVFRRRLSPQHSQRCMVTNNYAITLAEMGELDKALELHREVLRNQLKVLSHHHLDVLLSRVMLVKVLAYKGERLALLPQLSALLSGIRDNLYQSAFSFSPRGAAAHVEALEFHLTTVLSAVHLLSLEFADAEPVRQLQQGAFSAVANLRAFVPLTARIAHVEDALIPPDQVSSIRARIELESAKVARFYHQELDPPAFLEAVQAKEKAERDLRSLFAAHQQIPEISVERIAGALETGEAAVAFRSFVLYVPTADGKIEAGRGLAAFVVCADGSLDYVPLASPPVIEEAIQDWRRTLGFPAGPTRSLAVGPASPKSKGVTEQQAAERLRALLLDPILPFLADAERMFVALDGLLHLVPLDSLPLEGGFVGDRLEVVHLPALAGLLFDSKESVPTPFLLALGDINYDDVAGEEAALSGRDATRASVSAAELPEHALRALQQARFLPLDETGQEIDAVDRLYRQRFGSAAASGLLTGSSASRQEFFARAEEASFIHLATHGYFAPEEFRSNADQVPVDAFLDVGKATTLGQSVHVLAPMLLCGLALAGANQAAAEGAGRGVVTAEELSQLDLSRCQLIVLSACESNVGLHRTGLGIASMQSAFLTAGAHSVVSTLWHLPDRPARQFMEEFYRALWSEGQTGSQALWSAKQALRAGGAPTWHWAGWVLAGRSSPQPR